VRGTPPTVVAENYARTGLFEPRNQRALAWNDNCAVNVVVLPQEADQIAQGLFGPEEGRQVRKETQTKLIVTIQLLANASRLRVHLM
jgi:hypothetical protein